jgi:hypothetical protein
MPTPAQLAQSARLVAHRLRLRCPAYDSTGRRWKSQDLALWWQVLEETIVDTGRLTHTSTNKREIAAEAVNWFTTEGAGYLCEVLGLNVEYVQTIVNRWLALAYPEGG